MKNVTAVASPWVPALLAGSILQAALLAAPFASVAADPEKVRIVVFHLDPGSARPCAEEVEGFLAQQGIGKGTPQAEGLRTQICDQRIESMVLVTREAPAAPAARKKPVTIDVLGNSQRGNVNSASFGGKARYSGIVGGKHVLDLRLQGEARREDGGLTYHSFEASGTYDYLLDGHWSLFAFASAGRDTKKQIAFTASEVGGISYNVFSRAPGARSLRLSAGAGHRYQDRMAGAEPDTSSASRFRANNAILSYRLKYEEKFLKDSLSLVAAAWYQHILYAPGKEGSAARLLDPSDYRVLLELAVRIQVAKIGDFAQVSLNVGGTYEYYVTSATPSHYDLVLNGGIGVAF